MSTLAKKRADAQKLLGVLFSDPKRVLLIHYSCEDFANRPDGSSARVTSIAVRHLDSALTTSFSIHHSAELLKVPYPEIRSRYEELERHLLDAFNSFITKYISFTWVHWSMRDSNYGFPAIYHRCRLHNIVPTEIAATSLVDLARCLIDIYGSGYMSHPRMTKLMERNNISNLGLLDGLGEVSAFASGDYVGLHRSTLRKVDAFESILSRAHAGTLKTNYRWKDIYGRSPRDVVLFLKEHWIYSVLSMGALGFSLWKIGAFLTGDGKQ